MQLIWFVTTASFSTHSSFSYQLSSSLQSNQYEPIRPMMPKLIFLSLGIQRKAKNCYIRIIVAGSLELNSTLQPKLQTITRTTAANLQAYCRPSFALSLWSKFKLQGVASLDWQTFSAFQK
jgi:hypothetical protein